jgi:hypothetical protein
MMSEDSHLPGPCERCGKPAEYEHYVFEMHGNLVDR